VILDASSSAYLIAAIVMTLSVLEGHSAIESLFSSAIINIFGASHGPCASAKLLVGRMTELFSNQLLSMLTDMN